MADIRIHRSHTLGLTKARKIALQWAEEVEKNFSMECTILEGEHIDTVEFTRAGVKGELLVEAHQFTLEARLGFLLGAFSKSIESEIEKNLDALLATSKPAATQTPARPTVKKAPPKPAVKEAPAKPAVKEAPAKPAKKP